MSGHGGARPGAGRPKGAATTKTQKIAVQLLEDGGATPMEVMAANMRFAHGQADVVLAKIASMPEAGDQKAGFDLLKEMGRFRDIAQKCAADLAPYMHPRIQAVEPGAGDDKPAAAPDAPQHPGADHLESIRKRYDGGFAVVQGGKT